MVPATTNTIATHSQPTPSATRTDWTDFVNTIGTTVGPLLTLFGEQATKQFLSTSMGVQDSILLSVGPIGIITIAVSAIRIGGYRWMKAIIGRARESRTTAEQEFLSSTSQAICELWSGTEIVRMAATQNDHGMHTFTLVKCRDTSFLTFRQERPPPLVAGKQSVVENVILDAAKAYKEGLLAFDGQLLRHKADQEALKDLELTAPNLTFTVPRTVIHGSELRIYTTLGILLQASILTIPALATYHWRWLRKGNEVAHYAYGCFAAGTIAILIGLFCCGSVVERSTTERLFRAANPDRRYYTAPLGNSVLTTDFRGATTPRKCSIERILRLQFACTIGSQSFPSFAILNCQDDKTIRTSRLNGKDFNRLTVVACVITLAGFIIQFVGLGALHFSATVLVLGGSLLMTIVRAWLRRGLGNDPTRVKMPETDQLAWIAHRTLRNDWSNTSSDPVWGPVTALIRLNCIDFISKGLTDTFASTEADQVMNSLSQAAGLAKKSIKLQDDGLILGFCENDSCHQCPLVQTVKNIIDEVPNVPQQDYPSLASKVAICLLGIMEVLAGFNDTGVCNVQWKADQQSSKPPWAGRHWKIDVLNHLDTKTSWIIRTGMDDILSHLNEAEMLLTEDLLGGLCLWTNSLSSAIKYTPVDFASSGSKVRPGRIIGHGGGLAQPDFRAWMDTKHLKIINPNVLTLSFLDGFSPYFWPMFGLYYSSYFDYRADPSLPYQCVFTATEDEVEHQDVFLGSSDYYTLEEQCALEILSLFMLSVCRCIERVGGETKKVDGTMTNSVITAIAQKVVDAKLVTTMSAALTHIIPAFAKFNVLPDETLTGDRSLSFEKEE